MSAQAKVQQVQNFDDYLLWEESQNERHEFVGGVVYAMTGGTQAHHVVTANAFAELRQRFEPHCLTFSQGFKVRVRRDHDERAYYPDVFVTCRPGAADAQYNEHPCVVVEVLSESTKRVDLGEKLDAYTAMPSVETYLVLDPHRAVARVWRRVQGWAEETVTGLDAAVTVDCGSGYAPAAVSMRALYRNLFG